MMTPKKTIVALALTLAAGLAASALAGTPVLTTGAGKSGSTLSLNGARVYSTPALITHARVTPLRNSSTLVATWDESSNGSVTSYFALSLNGAGFDQVLATDNTLKLRYAQFDPLKGEPQIPDSLKAPPDNELYMVQFISTPLEEMRRDIQDLGGVFERYLPENAHLVRMPAATLEQVRALPYVRWVGAYHPAYRLSEEVLASVLSAQPRDAGIRYSVETLRDGLPQQQAVADQVLAMGGIVEGFTPDMHRLEVTVRPDQILQIARRNEISFIDPWGGPGGADMNVVRQLEGATPTLSNAGFTGQGVRGEVHDTEVRTTHQAFQSPPVLLHAGSAGNAANAHGSACYGIIFADWPTNTNYNGMCTSAEQGIYINFLLSSQFTAGQPSRLTRNTEATSSPYFSSFQTSSVGSTQVTTYTTLSQETDSYLFAVDYLSCQSQSNTGLQTSRPQAWAKNIVSVGGVSWLGTLARADDAWTSASYGPAADGRIKPDLTNCYDAIPSTWNSSDTGTTSFSGTSGATPITAGAFGLLLQMWHEGVWSGFGGGSSVFTDRPKSTTAKAMMINTAYRYPLTQGLLTRVRQGWGMPALDALYNIRAKTFIVNETDVLQNAQTKSYSLTVAAGEPEFKATMVYLDPAPATTASPNRVNDLSLRVTSPSGTVYWGNGGLSANNYSVAGGSADTLNTVENIFIQNPAPGAWTVDVIGTQIVQDARVETPGVVDADYALVVTGAVLVPAYCYANCDNSTIVPVLNANDFQCFINAFAAGDSYANCDGSTTDPLLTANDFTCFLNVFSAGCP